MTSVRESKVIVTSVRGPVFGNPFEERRVFKINVREKEEPGATRPSVAAELAAVLRAVKGQAVDVGLVRQLQALHMCAAHAAWKPRDGRVEAGDDDFPFAVLAQRGCSVAADGDEAEIMLGRPVLASGVALRGARALHAALTNGAGERVVVRALLFAAREGAPGSCMHTETFVGAGDAGAGDALAPVASAGRVRFVRREGLVPVGVLPVPRGASHAERNCRARSDHRQYLRSIGCGRLFSARRTARRSASDVVEWETCAGLDGGAWRVVSVFVPTTW